MYHSLLKQGGSLVRIFTAWGHAYESPLGPGAACSEGATSSEGGKSDGNYHPVQLPFVFFVFSTSVLLAQKFVIQCSSSQLVAFLFVFIKIKVHRLIFHTYHTDSVNIPDFQPNYKYQ